MNVVAVLISDACLFIFRVALARAHKIRKKKQRERDAKRLRIIPLPVSRFLHSVVHSHRDS